MDGEPDSTDRGTKEFRWWFLPSWLGLDAPCVVSTWTWATSVTVGIELPVRTAAAMFLVVWFIYLSDRLIDVAGCPDWTQATGRLRFGGDYRTLFLSCQGICLLGIAWLLWTGLPMEVLQRGALVALGVGLHALLFVVPLIFGAKAPGKEFGVGLFFSLGAYACLGATTRTMPLLSSIALVVAFNCLVIAARDAESDRVNDPGGASHWWQTMHRDLHWIGVALTIIALAMACLTRDTAFYLALAAAFALLTLLHRFSHRWSGDAVRALADFALFTPIPALLAARQFANG